MKQISTILNVVLLAAVGFLYYQNFAGKSKNESVQAGKNNTDAKNVSEGNTRHGNIAYIETDSLHENYLYFKSQNDELERRKKAVDNELIEKQKKYQGRAAQLQQQAQSMTPQQQEAAGKEMQAMQQDFEKSKQELENKLFDLANTMKKNVMKSIQDFLTEYNKDKKYDYILSYEPGALNFMFYKDSALNITKAVINGLNEQYKKKQP